MADADTGYGNAVTVYHVVQYFEEAGIVGINIEDQLMPKRCGHMRGKELVEPREMATKIEAAIKAKRDPDFVVNARTDAIAVEGIDGTVARIREYEAAGADMIYADAVRGEDDIKRVVDAAGDVPVNINMGFGIRLAADHAADFARPSEGPRRGARERARAPAGGGALGDAEGARGHEAVHGRPASSSTGRTSWTAWRTSPSLMGYARIAELESELLRPEDLERRYGEGERDYVVRGSSKG